MKIALLTNMLSPYRVPLLNQIHEQSADEWTAVFFHGSLSDRDWPDHTGRLAMPHHVLVPSRESGRNERVRAAGEVWGTLGDIDPDVIILGGYVDPACWSGLTWARTRGRRTILWMATWAGSRLRNDPVSVGLSRAYVRACSSFVAYSTRAAEYIAELGGDPAATFVGPNVGDVGFFGPAVREARARSAATASPSRDSRARLLYVGALSHRKAVDRIVHALARVGRADWELRLVGSGPEREELEAAIEEHGMEDRVTFVPHCTPDELVQHYAESHALVLPSRNEPGAIVLGEALASGLYTVVSDVDGVAPDLIQPGVTGELVSAGDPEAFAECLGRTIGRAVAGQFDPASIAASMERLGPDNYAKAFLRAVDHAREP